jgi:hypothetical protein
MGCGGEGKRAPDTNILNSSGPRYIHRLTDECTYPTFVSFKTEEYSAFIFFGTDEYKKKPTNVSCFPVVVAIFVIEWGVRLD